MTRFSVLLLLSLCAAPAVATQPPVKPLATPATITQETALTAPAGWHVRREVRPGHVAVFVSKEDIASNGGFLTGLSINSHARFQATRGMAPLAYAQRMAEVMRERYPGSERTDRTMKPGLDVIEVRMLDQSRLPNTLLLYLLVADSNTDTFHLAGYETPEPIFNAEWPHGDRLLAEFIQLVADGRTP